MDEFTKLTAPNPANRRERLWNQVACFQVHGYPARVHLSNIRAISPGNGDGTRALLWFTSLANKHGVSIIGEAEPTDIEPLLNKTALKRWYRRHGFKVSSRGDI